MHVAPHQPPSNGLRYPGVTSTFAASATRRTAPVAARPGAPGSWLIVALSWLVASGFTVSAYADTLTLAWSPSDPDVTRYVVYVGTTPAGYTQTFDAGNVLTFTLSAVVPGQRYCFAVTAWARQLESLFSDEVCGYSNMYPTLDLPNSQSSIVGVSASLQLVGGDPLGDRVTYSASGLPAGLTLNPNTGLISGIPTTVGASSVTITVSDGVLATTGSFMWLASARAVPTVHKATARAVRTGAIAVTRGAPPSTTGQPSPSGQTTRATASNPVSATPATHSILSGVAAPGATVTGTRTAPAATAPAATSLDSECSATSTGCVTADSVQPAPAAPTGASFISETVLTANTSRVSILTPVPQATFTAGAPIVFMGRAENENGQPLSRLVVWQSSQDGGLGAGQSIVKVLTAGTHTITASATLDDGRAISTSLTLVVRAAP